MYAGPWMCVRERVAPARGETSHTSSEPRVHPWPRVHEPRAQSAVLRSGVWAHTRTRHLDDGARARVPISAVWFCTLGTHARVPSSSDAWKAAQSHIHSPTTKTTLVASRTTSFFALMPMYGVSEKPMVPACRVTAMPSSPPLHNPPRAPSWVPSPPPPRQPSTEPRGEVSSPEPTAPHPLATTTCPPLLCGGRADRRPCARLLQDASCAPRRALALGGKFFVQFVRVLS